MEDSPHVTAISPLIGQGPHIPPSVIKTGVKLPQLQPQPGHRAADKVTGAGAHNFVEY